MARKNLGLTAEELAEKAKVPYPTLRDIEAGVSSGRKETKAKIASALNKNAWELEAPPGEIVDLKEGKLLRRIEAIETKLDKKQAQSMDPNRQELFDLILGLPKDLIPDAITDLKALIEAASDESENGLTRKGK